MMRDTLDSGNRETLWLHSSIIEKREGRVVFTSGVLNMLHWFGYVCPSVEFTVCDAVGSS